jgi:hypothetical protein
MALVAEHEAEMISACTGAARAEWIAPLVAELRAAGITSLRAVAAELNRRGVPAPRGGFWHANSVGGCAEPGARGREAHATKIAAGRSGETKSWSFAARRFAVADFRRSFS